ncbi:MAG: hypothetical protein KDA96_20200, partial [Planctomycetaceae bacterium]|nr:hypothetical protein [Planctomycetaceae bacterium]
KAGTRAHFHTVEGGGHGTGFGGPELRSHVSEFFETHLKRNQIVSGPPTTTSSSPASSDQRQTGNSPAPRITWQFVKRREDANGDGVVTREEFQGPRPLFARLDRTKDNRLTADDFADMDSEQGTEDTRALIASISKETLFRNRDGGGQTWFHPRACMVPDSDGTPVALMTLQEIGGSDYFGPVHWTMSKDLGKTWSPPEPIPALGRDPVPGRTDGLMAGVCDVTPQYHPQTKTVLALGHVVFYKGEYFARNEQLARYPVYVTRAADGQWSSRRILEWDDPRGAHIYSNNCGQRVVLPNGDVQMSFTFGPEENGRMAAGVRSTFDGHLLKITEVGVPMHNPQGRGLLEPSVAQFNDQFWITMRAEDNRGYVSVSSDGLNWDEKRAWCWDDGTPLETSTTQQHWLTHSDGLFLVYTRKDPSNENVIRWRSPLWVAQVDVEKRCLVRNTEQVVLPLMGDGINEPNQVALMGNFHVTNVSPMESWVTVGEWMPKDGYRGDVLLARIRWSRPNRLPLW